MVGTLGSVTMNTIETLMGLKGWMSVLNVSTSPVHVYIVYPKTEKLYLHPRVVRDSYYLNSKFLRQ